MTARMRPSVSVWSAIVIVMAFLAGIATTRAQDYPSRPITVIVPFPAGGASDVVARIVTNEMSKILGQSIVIENVGGAGGTIGSARAAAAAPDGYTLLAAAMGSHVAAPVLTPNIKYDPVADFVPIGITADSPVVIIARKDFPAHDLKEFVAVLRQQGGAVKEAHGGIGASSHMACLLFTAQIGAKPTLVAYRGSGPALNDLMGGHVDFLCEQSVSVAEQVLAGSVKAYAVSATERLAMLPNVPTATEGRAQPGRLRPLRPVRNRALGADPRSEPRGAIMRTLAVLPVRGCCRRRPLNAFFCTGLATRKPTRETLPPSQVFVATT